MGNRVISVFHNSKGVLVRALFILHAALSLYMMYVNNNFERIYWLLVLPIVFILFDCIHITYIKGGAEMDFVWPSGFFYIASIVPQVWIIEMNLLDHRKSTRASSDSTQASSNSTSMIMNNDLAFWLRELDTNALSKKWVEIGVFICLILGRWLMPRSNLSREQLSALLLGYIGTSADILKLFESLQIPDVVYEQSITIGILIVYTIAVIQFSLTTTSSFDEVRKKKTVENKQSQLSSETSTANEEINGSVNNARKQAQPHENGAHAHKNDTCMWHDEFYQIFVTVFMHDGPFFVVRLSLCIKYNVINELHIFFLVKNVMVIFLLVFRLFVLACHCKQHIIEDDCTNSTLATQLHDSSDIDLVNAVSIVGAVAGRTRKGDSSPIVDNDIDPANPIVDNDVDFANPIVDNDEAKGIDNPVLEIEEGNGVHEESNDADKVDVNDERTNATLIDIEDDATLRFHKGHDSVQLQDSNPASPVKEDDAVSDTETDIKQDASL